MTDSAFNRAQVLVEALPYIRRFHGQRVVIKVGGKAIEQRQEETLLDIVLLRYVGLLPVLVHGGGAEVTAWSSLLGLEAEFREGLRVTDEATIELVKMVLTGKVNPQLVANLNRLGGQAVGMSGEDGPLIWAQQLDPELGYVGQITKINPEPVVALLERGYIPVIASIGHGHDGHAYNINADTVAAEMALALKAAKLLLLTDVPGVLDEQGRVISNLSPEVAKEMIASGVASGGMVPKLKACLRALEGVPQAHIIDGRESHPLLLELFTETGVGSLIS